MKQPLFVTKPPNDLLALVGLNCAWWQYVESLVDYAIWDWAGLSIKRGRCITAHMSFPLRCDAWRALCHAKFENEAYDRTLGKLIEDHLKPTQKIRNRFAHALWLASDDKSTHALLEKPSRHKHEMEIAHISRDELRAAHLEIAWAYVNTLVLILDFEKGRFEPKTWREKLQKRASLYDEISSAQQRYLATKGRRLRPPQPYPA